MQKNKHNIISAFSKIPCKFLPFCTCCRDQSNKIYLAKRYSKIKPLTIYDKELEFIPEFGKFEDNIRKFKFYGLKGDHKKPKTIAILKGNIHLYRNSVSNDEQSVSRSKEFYFSGKESQFWPRLKLNAKCNIIVRVYILRAHNLHPKDINGLSDPYIKILFGECYNISDQKNRIPKSLNPLFGRCYEKEVSLPECSILKIKVMDYDRFKKDELIGETIIDIEARYFSKHRAHCGLPKQYNKDGYNRWRDCESPSQILHKLCLFHTLKPPIYTENSVIIGTKIFNNGGKNIKADRQSLALNVLNHWQDMPVIGYHLVPEHVETRTLFNPKIPNIHQGTLEMWVDMFSKNDNLPEIVDVKPPIVENYELRVIIWSVTDVKLIDDDYFTGEKHSDIYIKGWLPSTEKQSTDIHYRSLNGEGLFNWRFKFLFLYNKIENIIVQKIKNIFSIDGEEQKFLPRLHLQIWDNDHLSPDSYIGFLTLDLWNMPRGTKSSWRCTTSEKVPRINLFKVKKTRGWWPFISTENNINSIVGKVDAEIQIMTKLEADKSPVGFGRDKPQPLSVPKRPSIKYLKSIMEPFKFMISNVFVANKTKCIYIVIIFSILLFFMLFIYSIPGYLVKKLMNT
uniref:Otoferlin n=1 Tax=Sipha flava TaxID=143950 RepID=A0A2S2R2V1_9HEMI